MLKNVRVLAAVRLPARSASLCSAPLPEGERKGHSFRVKLICLTFDTKYVMRSRLE